MKLEDLKKLYEAAADLCLDLHSPEGPDNHSDMYSIRNGAVRAFAKALATLEEP